VANGGFLHDPRDVFSDERALQAARARIDAVMDALGDTICAWELMAEMAFICTREFWQTDGWGDELNDRIRGEQVPWVETMAQYIHSIHPAPVGNGQVFAPLGGLPDGPDHFDNVRNEVFKVPSLDFALINWYGQPVDEQLAWLRTSQDYTGKPIYIEQYAPWRIRTVAPYAAPEPLPYADSKIREWIAACGERGVVGPSRWLEIRPRDNWRAWYGVASPQMAEIAGVTWEFAQHVNLDDWKRGWNYDHEIEADNTRLVASWGDGRHVTALVAFGDNAPHDVIIYGLSDGSYAVRAFDWLSGAQVRTIDVTAINGEIVLPSMPVVEGAAVLYVSPAVSIPEPPTNDDPIVLLSVRDVETNEQRAVALEPGREYRLEVEVRG